MNGAAYFSETYPVARRRFCDAADQSPSLHRRWGERFAESDAQGRALAGRYGEELATDIAWFGPADAPNVLILGSGTHGAEGLAGSGAQAARAAHATSVSNRVVERATTPPRGCE